jgi:type IV pilus assembly protein PilP
MIGFLATLAMPTEPYVYSPVGKRDPFATLGAVTPLPSPCSEHQPAMCWAVGEFQVSAVVWGETPRALLVDPNGASHLVEVGTYVGERWGRVESISPDHVVVVEELVALDGELLTNRVVLELPAL